MRIQWHAFVHAYACKHISGQAYIQYLLNTAEALHLHTENLPLQWATWGFSPFCFPLKHSCNFQGIRDKVSNSGRSVCSRCDLCCAQQKQLCNCLQWGNLSVQRSLAFASTSSIYCTGNRGGEAEEGGEMERGPLTHPLALEPQPEGGKCCGKSQFRCSLPQPILVYFHKSAQILEWDLLAGIFTALLVMTFYSKCTQPVQDLLDISPSYPVPCIVLKGWVIVDTIPYNLTYNLTYLWKIKGGKT